MGTHAHRGRHDERSSAIPVHRWVECCLVVGCTYRRWVRRYTWDNQGPARPGPGIHVLRMRLLRLGNCTNAWPGVRPRRRSAVPQNRLERCQHTLQNNAQTNRSTTRTNRRLPYLHPSPRRDGMHLATCRNGVSSGGVHLATCRNDVPFSGMHIATICNRNPQLPRRFFASSPRRNTSPNVANCTGFVTYSSIPAARHFASSSFKASAVIAMIHGCPYGNAH